MTDFEYTLVSWGFGIFAAVGIVALFASIIYTLIKDD